MILENGPCSSWMSRVDARDSNRHAMLSLKERVEFTCLNVFIRLTSQP